MIPIFVSIARWKNGSIDPFNSPSSTHTLRLQIPGYVPPEGITNTNVSETKQPIRHRMNAPPSLRCENAALYTILAIGSQGNLDFLETIVRFHFHLNLLLIQTFKTDISRDGSHKHNGIQLQILHRNELVRLRRMRSSLFIEANTQFMKHHHYSLNSHKRTYTDRLMVFYSCCCDCELCSLNWNRDA